jgi:CO/xanthine dehydrogenase Mo-binding subunit
VSDSTTAPMAAAPSTSRDELSATTGVEVSDKATGGARYAADIRLPDLVEVVFVYSPFARARIRGVDTSAALDVDGVVAVVTGADIGHVRYGRWLQDEPLLAVDEVRFAGQRVAAVAARDRATAALAAGLVDVDYDDLPALDTVAAASSAGADALHPDYDDYVGHRADRSHVNEQGFQEVVVGDPDGAWPDADVVVDETYRVDRSHAAPLEPHACVVDARDSSIDVWSSHKEPFNLRRHLATVSGLPVEAVTVHPTPVGGDFGSKGSAFHELACAFVSRAAGRPVRSVLTYAEMLLSTSARHGAELRLRTATKDGRVTAHAVDATLDGGAFGAHKAHPLGVVFVAGMGLEPYDVPARRDRCTVFYTSSLPASHVRGPGLLQTIFASESHLDEVARQLDADPIAFRRQHAAEPEMDAVLEALQRHVDEWRAEADGRTRVASPAAAHVGRGIGVAAFIHRTGPGNTTVEVAATLGAGIEVRVAVPDQGAGAHDSVRRIAARVLGVDETAVRVRQVAPDAELVDAGAGASRVTTIVGDATAAACRALLDDLDPGGRRSAISSVDDALRASGRDAVVARGSASSRGFGRASFGALAVDAAVCRTGRIEVQRAALVVDTGAVVNPVGHRGQLEGAFAFGFSQALYEQLEIIDGQVAAASLGDYDVVKCADIPPLTIEVLGADRDPEVGSFGSVGELANLGVAPAIGNAVAAATGVRVRRLPMTPEVVWTAMRPSGPVSR